MRRRDISIVDLLLDYDKDQLPTNRPVQGCFFLLKKLNLKKINFNFSVNVSLMITAAHYQDLMLKINVEIDKRWTDSRLRFDQNLEPQSVGDKISSSQKNCFNKYLLLREIL